LQWALNFVDLVNFSLPRKQKCIEKKKIKIQSFSICYNGRFCTSKILKIDFT